MKIRLILVAVIVLSMTALAQRTRLKPGFNSFSPEDDVKLGKEVAQQAEKELNLVTNRTVTSYIAALGQQLVAKSPNEYKFPFTFKVVDDKSINAFALPGGPIYVHRGAIEAADNEAQIAGVMGHEIAHIILRHGTNQASKGQLFGGITGALGGLFGGSKLGQVAALGGTFAANSVLLKYSRDAETQADLMGTQILYDSGYDPRAMAQFFDKLAKEHKGSAIEEFFSNHPIPENRVEKVNAEIRKIGPEPRNPRRDTRAFQNTKRTLLGMPVPKAKPRAANDAQENNEKAAQAAPPVPSTRMSNLEVAAVRLQYPDNWKTAVDGNHAVLAPEGGMNQRGDLAYGMIIDVYKLQNPRNLDQANSQFLTSLKESNPAMKTVRSPIRTQVDGFSALVTEVSNESPFGGTETDIIVTLLLSDTELQYFVQVAPSKDMPKYARAFQTIMDSVRVR